MASPTPIHSRGGLFFALSGAALFITSIALLTFTGQTWSSLATAIEYSGVIPPVVRVYSDDTPDGQNVPVDAIQEHVSYIYLAAFWAIVLNLLTGAFSLTLMCAAMFYKECGSARRRSVRNTPFPPQCTDA